jgi:hypothetical protein
VGERREAGLHPSLSGFRLVLVALPILALADVPLRGLDGTVDLLVVLMVGVALGEPRYFVDPAVRLSMNFRWKIR